MHVEMQYDPAHAGQIDLTKNLRKNDQALGGGLLISLKEEIGETLKEPYGEESEKIFSDSTGEIIIRSVKTGFTLFLSFLLS